MNSTADLSDEEIQAVSVYGSEDGVLNLENYKKYAENLPLVSFLLDHLTAYEILSFRHSCKDVHIS